MHAVAHDYRQCVVQRPKDPPEGLDAWVDKLIGRLKRRRRLAADLLRDAQAIDDLVDFRSGHLPVLRAQRIDRGVHQKFGDRQPLGKAG